MTEYDLLIEEAVDRLDEGIADDVADAVAQLVEESLCLPHEEAALAHDLRYRGYA